MVFCFSLANISSVGDRPYPVDTAQEIGASSLELKLYM